MIGSRVLGAACAAILISSLGTLAGCAGSDEKPEASAQTIQAASVSLILHDANGTRVGEGSGILIAPRVVLTSGHLIAGRSRWTVTSADGKTRVNGVRGMTYDWMTYNSDKAHPRKHDVGVIYLDRPINLPLYPKLSDQKQASGTQATRIRGTGGGFQQIPAVLSKFSTFPNAYVTELGRGETLDTGGAVVNDKFEIVGLVTGQGMQTGKLHIARVNDLVQWLSPKVSCGHKSAKALQTRTYGTPPPKDGCEENGASSSGGSSGTTSSGGSSGGSSGTTSGSSSGGSSGGSSGTTSGSSSGGSTSGGSYDTPPNGSSSGGSSSGGSSSGGDDGVPGNCDDGGGGYNSDGSPNPPTGGSSSSSSSGGSSSGGSSGSDSNSSGSSSGGSSGSSGASSGSSSGGSSGTSGNVSSSGGSSGSSGASSSSGGNDVPPGGGDSETCTGTHDNPDVCPPEPNGCTGPDCGGGQPDDTINYGGYNGNGSDDGTIRLN